MLARMVVCAVCQEVFRSPVMTDCGHTFCGACLTSWLFPEERGEVFEGMRKCPVCRKKVGTVIKNLEMAAFVEVFGAGKRQSGERLEETSRYFVVLLFMVRFELFRDMREVVSVFEFDVMNV
jgi:hypothetical protein